MLRWTPSGAVSTPATVQIRVEVSFPDRLQAGAPLPPRRLEPEELRDNIHYFTRVLDGPRTRPCTSLVLSGHGVATRTDLPDAVRVGRESGLGWVVLHAGAAEIDHIDVGWMGGAIDRLVLPVHSADTVPELVSLVDACRAVGVTVVLAVDLRRSILPHLEDVARRLGAAQPAAVVFTWPFPGAVEPAPRAPAPGSWKPALEAPLDALPHTPTLIRGLPLCHVPGRLQQFRRTTNRWYVDAAHQRADALLFLPDVVQFAKSDACRFCAQDGVCDGFFQPYLDAGHPPLKPVG